MSVSPRLVLHALLPPLAWAHTSAACEAWCINSCALLNGNVEQECGACAGEEHLCRRGMPGFAWRDRRKVASASRPPNMPAAAAAALDAFDEQHGCRQEEEAGECASWDLDELPARLEQGHAYCRHARCLAQKLAADGAPVDPTHFARAPTHYMSHEYFPLRLGGAELLVAICASVAATHLLEGASCLSSVANQTESHDIARRWMGVESMSRLVGGSGHGPRREWGVVSGQMWDEHGEPGGSLCRQQALREMINRLEHWQPGTRWMALHGVTLFFTDRPAHAAEADAADGADLAPQVLDGLMRSLTDDMGFPGIGLLAMEAIPRLFGGGMHTDDTLERLADVLDPSESIASRGSTPVLVRLLAIEAVRRLGPSASSAALEQRVAWQMASDSDGERGWKFESSSELIARARDRRALEAIGCTIPADPGDLLLFFPGIYHRTQDLRHARVAIIAEATQA